MSLIKKVTDAIKPDRNNATKDDIEVAILEIEKELDGEHSENGQHDLGLSQQVETGHLTDSFATEYLAEVLRWLGSSGVMGVRQYATNPAFDSKGRRTHSSFSSINLHDHSNYKSMPGLGELAMVLNGYYYRSRHNDYKMRKSVIAPSTELGYESLHAPELPASVLAKPTGVNGETVDTASDTQAKYIKEVFDENPQDVEVHIVYAELWREFSQTDQTDHGESFRHSDAISNTREALERGVRYNSSGQKDTLENLFFSQTSKASLSATGLPTSLTTQFRIMCAKAGTLADIGDGVVAPIISISRNNHGHVISTQLTDQQAQDLRDGTIAKVDLTSTDSGHTHIYEITWDGANYIGVDTNATHQHEVLIENNYTGNLPFNKDMARDGVIDDKNRFALVKDDTLVSQLSGISDYDELNASTFGRFTCADLERMCERVPGLDGENGAIDELSIDNGLGLIDRDLGSLNAAYYNRRIGLATPDAAGRGLADRGLNDSNLFVARNTKEMVYDNVSYMIPIEIILRSPEENWNPYDIAFSADRDSVTGTGTQANPYSGYSEQQIYNTVPKGLHGAGGVPDPADTSTSKWMVSGIDGVARECIGSGVRPFNPDGQRIRIPVYPVFQEFSHEAQMVSSGIDQDAGKAVQITVAGSLALNSMAPNVFRRIDTQGLAATDDLTSISGDKIGQQLIIALNSSARSITVVNSANIILTGGSDIVLDTDNALIEFICLSNGVWKQK